MTAHAHTELVPGCHRCELNKDEYGWSVQRDTDRVFLRISNYEFEIKVPATSMGASPEFMAISTERLLTEKMHELTELSD